MPSTKGIDVVMGTSARALFFKSDTSATEVPALLQAIKDAGIQKIDNAPLYGQSEELLGEYGAVEKYELVIDTKIPGGLQPGTASKEQVIAIVQESLRKLKTSTIDILYIHTPDDDTPISSTLAGINELHTQGAFRRFGLSNFHPAQVREIHAHCKDQGYILPTVYQGNYNAFARHYESGGGPDDALLPLLRDLGISFYAYSPTAGGFLTKPHDLFGQDGTNSVTAGRFDMSRPHGRVYNTLYNKPSLVEGLRKWNAVADAAGIKPLAMALRWVRYNSALSDEYADAIILGGRTLEQTVETMALVNDGPLPDDVVRGIDEVWEIVKGEAPVDNFHSFIKTDMETQRKSAL